MIILRLTILLTALATLTGSSFAGDFCDLADDITEKAVITFNSDQNDALKLFIIARELCTNDPASAYNLGVAYYRYGSLAEAQEYFEEAVSKNDPASAYNLGVAYYRYGSLAEAQEYFEEAVNKDDRNAAALNNLAQVILERQGDSARALNYAEKAVELVNSPATQETLARARFAAGSDVEALEGLQKAMLESSEPRLKVSYDDLLNRYLSARLEKIKAGGQL